MTKKKLHQLGVKVTDTFLNNTNYNVYKTDDKLVKVVDLIRSYAKDKLRAEWRANNVLRMPYTVNSVNPVGLMMRAGGKDEDFIEFYCHNTLSQKEIHRAMYLISNSITEFIHMHREGLEEYNANGIDIDDIDFDCTLRGNIDPKFLKENTALIKALFVRELANCKIKVGVSDDEKYITDGRELQFYPCYSSQGHELISEVVDIDIKGKIHKLAFYIQPNIEPIGGELYIFPIIGVKRFIEPKATKKAIQWSNGNNSILVFDGENYHSPRVRWDMKDKEVKPLVKDYKLYKYIEDYKGISYDEIKDLLNNEEDSNHILLPYNNKMKRDIKIKAGVSTVDKFDIFNYIINNIEGLEPMEEISDCLWKRNKDFSNISPSNSKLKLDNCIYRSDKTNVVLHVTYDKNRESNFYDEIIKVIEESLVDENKGLKVENKGSYILQLADKEIYLTVKDVPTEDCLIPTWEKETLDDRTSQLRKDISLEEGLNIALVELEWRNDKTDAKSMVRTALNSLGVVNQFITPKDKDAKNEIRSAILDLFNDIGVGNRVQILEEDTVIYTMHKVKGIDVIARMDNDTIEVSIPSICDFTHITEIPRLLSDGVLINNNDSISHFLTTLENEKRRKIVILEGGEEQKNSIIYSMDIPLINKIQSLCDIYVTTNLFRNREVVQTNNGEVTLGTAYYKVKDGVYISIGERGKGKVVVQSSKIREWINTKGNVSYGATSEYKDRIAYEIRANGNYDDSICRLVHNLRLNTNTHIHLNRSVLVDYISKLDKSIGGTSNEK